MAFRFARAAARFASPAARRGVLAAASGVALVTWSAATPTAHSTPAAGVCPHATLLASPSSRGSGSAPPVKGKLITEPHVMDAAYYQRVYAAVSEVLEDLDYDDGSYGPVLVRLAWHAAGTYDAATGTGGSNGATMRFEPESKHGANAGLQTARDRLESVKRAFPDMSYSDLWSLAGVCAIQQMGGPIIPWRPGRVDSDDGSKCTPDGRLPDASQGNDHVRAVFYRMGFNDQEIVALLGAHAMGRCHADRSGYDGPWTRAPTTFSNDYFKRLLEEEWVVRKWSGPKQYADKAAGDLMMLPADLALTQDPVFSQYAKLYASDDAKFRTDFAAAFSKLLSLGVPFPAAAKTLHLSVVE